MRKSPPGGLMVLSPGDLTVASGAQFIDLVRACAVESQLTAVLLREPQLADGALLNLLTDLCELRRESPELWVGVHDRVHLALAAGADGVHLGFRSLPVVAARRVAGDQCAIGLSTHVGDPSAAWYSADYLFHGPVYDTPSKRGLVNPIGESAFAEFCGQVELPVWAIGGLEPAHAPQLLESGAAGAAVLRGVSCAEDPVVACRAWTSAWPRELGAGR